MSKNLAELFARNRAWASSMEARTPGFFTSLLDQQAPQYLWIGCADSRVPANEIVDLLPGELFVHRNVANVVVHSDLNCLSVMQYAVDRLGVRHIMVVGHYGCGGVAAALLDQRAGLVDNWLRHVQDVRNAHQGWLNTLPNDVMRLEALCELNVLAQVVHACQTTVVQDAWLREQPLVVHGWCYGLRDGLLQDLGMAVDTRADVVPRYRAAVLGVKTRYAARAGLPPPEPGPAPAPAESVP